jgi:hypothetical protein
VNELFSSAQRVLRHQETQKFLLLVSEVQRGIAVAPLPLLVAGDSNPAGGARM